MFWNMLKSKNTEAIQKENEDNLNLSSGAYILRDCHNVMVSGNAVVLESYNSTYYQVTNKAKILIFDGGEIYEVSGHAKIGLIKSGNIFNIRDKATVETINEANIDYVSGHAKVGTFNAGSIKFLDDKSKLETFNNGSIMFVRGNAKIGTMVNGNIVGMLNNAEITTMLKGKISYTLNKSYLGTTYGEIGEVCDHCEISTVNDGSINLLSGSSIVLQNMGGKIKNVKGNAIVIYTQKKERVKKEKKVLDKTKITKEVEQNEEIKGEQISLDIKGAN